MTFDVATPGVGHALITVALVEDEASLQEHRDLFELTATGFAVTGMSTALALYRYLLAHEVDIVVLGSEPPDEDRLSVMRHLRLHASLRIVVLESGEIPHGCRHLLHSNADKVLTGQVGTERLTAALIDISCSLRRSRKLVQNVANPADHRWWHLEADTWCLVAPNDERIVLSRSEGKVLAVLISESGRVMTRGELIKRLSSDAQGFDQRRLEMVIYRLRRKVMMKSGLILPLLSVRSAGYVFSIHRLAE